MNTQAAALSGQWIITSAEGVVPRSDHKMTLEFANGQVWGTAPCNSFTTTVMDTGGMVGFMPFEMGNAVCNVDIMEQEQRFIENLQRIESYWIDGDDLVFSTVSGPVIRARRAG